MSDHRWDLIIFDCDGVLIDSEVLSAEVLIELLAPHGVRIDFDHVRRHFLGRSFPTVASHIRDELGVALPEGFEAQYRALLLQRFETGLRPMPGIAEVLAALAEAGQPFCVATSSSPQRVARSLEITGLTAAFGPRVFTASQVARGKPAPDLFELAAATLNADPARCLVIEDSRPGLEAARAAGMRSLLFTGGSHMSGFVFDLTPPVPAFDDWSRFETLCDSLDPAHQEV